MYATQIQKPTPSQIEKIKEKLNNYIEFINNNEIYVNQLPAYNEQLHNSLNAKGFTLVTTKTLADFYKIEEYCNSNNLDYLGTF